MSPAEIAPHVYGVAKRLGYPRFVAIVRGDIPRGAAAATSGGNRLAVWAGESSGHKGAARLAVFEKAGAAGED